MYSEDDDDCGGFLDRGRSPTPDKALGRNSESARPRSGGPSGKGGNKGQRSKTTGKELPKLNSIHRGTIASVQNYGAFVRLGDGSLYKDGLLHISRLSSSGRVESVEDVVTTGDTVWVKVLEVKEEEGKFGLDMRYVGQKDGEDKDPNNVHADSGGGRGGAKPEPIRIGAVQATTCSRCGARGHTARECFASAGKHYSLVEEDKEHAPISCEKPLVAASGHDPKIIKKALHAYLKRKKLDESASSTSSESTSSTSDDKKAKKKKKKKKKEEKDKKRKEKKKDKKSEKKKSKVRKKDKNKS